MNVYTRSVWLPLLPQTLPLVRCHPQPELIYSENTQIIRNHYLVTNVFLTRQDCRLQIGLCLREGLGLMSEGRAFPVCTCFLFSFSTFLSQLVQIAGWAHMCRFLFICLCVSAWQKSRPPSGPRKPWKFDCDHTDIYVMSSNLKVGFMPTSSCTSSSYQ